jgi:hypothetical protein
MKFYRVVQNLLVEDTETDRQTGDVKTRICRFPLLQGMGCLPVKEPAVVPIIAVSHLSWYRPAMTSPNVLVEWLTRPLRIREVPGSIFGPGYPY